MMFDTSSSFKTATSYNSSLYVYILPSVIIAWVWSLTKFKCPFQQLWRRCSIIPLVSSARNDCDKVYNPRFLHFLLPLGLPPFPFLLNHRCRLFPLFLAAMIDLVSRPLIHLCRSISHLSCLRSAWGKIKGSGKVHISLSVHRKDLTSRTNVTDHRAGRKQIFHTDFILFLFPSQTYDDQSWRPTITQLNSAKQYKFHKWKIHIQNTQKMQFLKNKKINYHSK